MRRSRSHWLALVCAAPLACAGPRDARAAAAPAALPAPALAATAFEPLRGVGASARGRDADGAWLRFESEGPGALAVVGSAAPLSPPLDLRGRFVSLRVRFEHAERITGAELRLVSAGGSYAMPVTIFTDPTMNLLEDGGWLDLTFSLGAARRDGAPERGAIERVEWWLAESDAEGPRLVGYVGGLASHRLPPEGVVSFTFDDGYDEHYTVAAPLLAEHGFRGTAYVMPDQIDQPGYLSTEQARALVGRYGWELAAHHFTPLTEFAPAELPKVLDGVQAWLAANGAGDGRLDLAYPLGKHDAGVLAQVRRRFASARLASGGVETIPPADPLRLRAYNVLSTTTPAELGAAARRAREEREWLILMFHWLVDAPQRDTEYAIARLRDALAEIEASGVAVRTVDEVRRSFGAGVSAARAGAPAAPRAAARP